MYFKLVPLTIFPFTICLFSHNFYTSTVPIYLYLSIILSSSVPAFPLPLSESWWQLQPERKILKVVKQMQFIGISRGGNCCHVMGISASPPPPQSRYEAVIILVTITRPYKWTSILDAMFPVTPCMALCLSPVVAGVHHTFLRSTIICDFTFPPSCHDGCW